jgi:phosphonate transport system substrate-binding protein
MSALRHLLCAALLCAAALSGRAGPAASSATSDLFRIGFSSSMFSDVNVDDARAAMKVWIRTVGHERNIPIDPEPEILFDAASARRALAEKHIDGLVLTADLFHALRADISFELLAEAVNDGVRTEEYLLVAHEAAGIASVADLRGRSLIVFHNPRTCLAVEWIDGLLRGQGLPPSSAFFSGLERTGKASHAMLPVFFRKVDAALVTRRAFKLAGELNPQVLERLKIVATSPPVHPSFFAFRTGSTALYRDDMIAAIKGLKDSTAGRQILLLAQTVEVEAAPVTNLTETMNLIDQWRSAGVTNAGAAVAPGGRP